MLAWMFENGQMTTRQFAQKASVEGYEWAAMEFDDYGNDARWPDFRDECNTHGILPLVWFTTGGEIYRTPSDAQGCIAEVEGPGDLEGVTNVINGTGAGPLPKCSLAICTNFSTLNRANCKPLIDAGFSCLTESYMNEAANITPDSMDRIARQLGWATSQPVFGVYPAHGVPAPSYAQWADWPGVDYLGEYVL